MSEATNGETKQSGSPGRRTLPHGVRTQCKTGYATNLTLLLLCRDLGFILTYDAIERLLVCINDISEPTIANAKHSGSNERRTLPQND